MKLVACLDQLEISVGSEREYSATVDALRILNRYVEVHFRFEENMLLERGYPKLAGHVELHRSIKAQLARLYRHLQSGGEVTEDLMRLLREWLTSHIGEEDMEYAAFLGTRPGLPWPGGGSEGRRLSHRPA
jgi:hemerythrin